MSVKEVVEDVKEIMNMAKELLKADELHEDSLLQIANIIAISKLVSSTKLLSDKIDDFMYSLDSGYYVDEEEMGYS